MSDDSSKSEIREKKILKEACELIREKDSFRLINFLSQDATSEETCKRFSNLVRVLYFEKKDVSGMVLCGRVGIQYALKESETTGDEEATKLLSLAKEISYNLSANCWPGWGDEGIIINSTDLKAGMDAAKLNYRLAIQLEKPEEKVGNAHWLLGVHLLASEDYSKAIEQFNNATEKFKQANKDDFFWMAKGYVALATILSKNDKGNQLELEAIAALEKIGSDDALFYIKQIEKAKQIFQK